ncbi:CesT family type III secretion system chaperone|uniref:CesT family type III secretion system chaperone n=1 Tax=Noviherbaspirillum sp. L7-7A TaxID=2850560 RepID=UPI001C2B928B|nr:CesT family type III secretion system chaperone [Noviherbaspirillum sp. L7-7A]MBV0879523.1 CesT family type III secretion system chaperone [Noviherbaspirillum sp. L7-7A]
MEQEFRQLIDEFCALTGLEEPDAIAEGTSFNVDEVECAIIHQNHITPEAIYCYIDFGLPPGHQINAVYDNLLKENYLQFATTKASFSLSPHTGHVILVIIIQLAEATGKMLAEQFSYYAQRALAWRENCFLFDVDAADPASTYDNRIPYS